MWHVMPPLAQGVEEVPITHVTNGVHVPTWMGPHHAPPARASTSAPGGRWLPPTRGPGPRSRTIPDEELWRSATATAPGPGQLRAGNRGVAGPAGPRRSRWERGSSPCGAFDPERAHIGFARRAAAYKRWFLLIHDRSRALGLLTGSDADAARPGRQGPSPRRGGQAHPAVGLPAVRASGNVGERVAFLEDYDMGHGRRAGGGVRRVAQPSRGRPSRRAGPAA